MARVVRRETNLPENKGCYAAVLDYVLSPSESDALVQKTTSPTAADPAHDLGAPALVNIGGGLGTDSSVISLHDAYRRLQVGSTCLQTIPTSKNCQKLNTYVSFPPP